ncbi:spore germination protein [Mechercharimyces sp. CAU 1602]|uniref:GerAB/ArcD/ProY family transporter n=1 Tax=Mechercharimyces sp. CAU 1602 TaxID=2973933 RepID=UPI002163410A|nr:spore germination protein [Mechercharimyces sp. CAU 1602]MCS1351392.1 spore germination protein [Mechercharimyces sp. CAU 1602]
MKGNPNLREGGGASITGYQAFALLFNSILGITIFLLPYEMVQYAKEDGVTALILSALVVMMIVMIITLLCVRYPRKNLVQLTREALGTKSMPWLGSVLGMVVVLPFALYWLFATAISARLFTELVVSAVYIRTPVPFILGILIIVATMVASNPPHVVARFNELILWLLFVTVPLSIATGFSSGSLNNMLPLLQTTGWDLFMGVIAGASMYGGYSVVLMFSSYYQEPRRAWRVHIAVIIVITFFYLQGLLSTLAVFGAPEVVKLMWPVLELIKSAEFKVLIFERLESLVIAIWVTAVFSTMINYLSALFSLVIQFLHLKAEYRKGLAWGIAPVLFGLAMRPQNIQDVFAAARWIGVFGLGITVVFPILLLCLSFVRKQNGSKERRRQHEAKA